MQKLRAAVLLSLVMIVAAVAVASSSATKTSKKHKPTVAKGCIANPPYEAEIKLKQGTPTIKPNYHAFKWQSSPNANAYICWTTKETVKFTVAFDQGDSSPFGDSGPWTVSAGSKACTKPLRTDVDSDYAYSYSISQQKAGEGKEGKEDKKGDPVIIVTP